MDIALHADAGEQLHHLVFARLNDGVTYDQLDAAGDDEFFELVTLRGGNGSLSPGDSATLTLDLAPGSYEVLDLPNGEVAATARTTVNGEDGSAPDTDGTITLGPGFAFHIPTTFDGSGTWMFVNSDPDVPHEAVLVALDRGATAADVAKWAATFDGPPPGELVGGFGALSGEQRGWLHLGNRLAAGRYALVCLLPGPDGTAHAAKGMVSDVTID